MIIRNYEKDAEGLLVRMIRNMSVRTILQYINCKKDKSIDWFLKGQFNSASVLFKICRTHRKQDHENVT